MQLAKVMITSALILVVCAEELPKGKDYVLKCTLVTLVRCLICSLCVPVTNVNYHQGERIMHVKISKWIAIF